ncbi:nitrogen regulation protein NR(II) [Paraburkholderia sp. Cpub6]|uniref:two-component system sensor histidine kinase NtrB n=1 Tax=Paraburkholderia sp. Cpub6 TaxID=2723094 RepID=UPI00161A962A|nr:ATP-binding protein [Paraburkholderia sp. Cpub6]MBB5460296.1 two-component system sensor kinase FixL [Paraburkholderia sp. Cpub6]
MKAIEFCLNLASSLVTMPPSYVPALSIQAYACATQVSALPSSRYAGDDQYAGVHMLSGLRSAAGESESGRSQPIAGSGSRFGIVMRLAEKVDKRIRWFGRRIRESHRILTEETSLREAFELVPLPIGAISADGKIVFVNAKAIELFGYSNDELIGASEHLLFPHLRPDEAGAALERAGSAPASSAHARQPLIARRSDGHEFPVEVTTSRWRGERGLARLLVIVDGSGWHEFHRNREEMAHLTRISALGEMAGSLAHELNQPLTAIRSNVQAAQRFIEADPMNLVEVRECLRDAVSDNCRAGEIIRRIRTLVKKGDVELQSISVGSVARDVVQLVHTDALVRKILVTLDVAVDLPAVLGDKVQLQQVVLNLMLNGFDAMHDCQADDRVLTVQVAQGSHETVCIAVIDRGQGLTGDQLDKIFKPFFTSKPHGLGLGLSISRNIVNAHGGRLWAENNADRGASFYVSLPSERATVSNRPCQKP